MTESRLTLNLNHKLLLVIAALFCSLALSLISSHASHARQDPLNGAERYVQNGSNPDGRYIGPNCTQFSYNIGTLWVARDDGSQNEDIVISGGATSVNVRLYSTVRACSASYRSSSSYSNLGHVSQCNGWVPMTLIPQGTSRNMFHAYSDSYGQWEYTRYYIPDRNRGAGQWWSDPFNGGNYIRATLNVAGLGTGNYNVCLRGTFSQDGYCRSGWCFAADRQIGFRIIREYRWDLTPTSTMTSPASVNQPGQTLSWQHSIRNNGPDGINRTVTYRAQNQGDLGNGTVSSWNVGSLGSGATTSQTSSKAITQGDVGKNLCRQTVVVPRAWNNGGELGSAGACRSVPYNYSLTSNVTNVPEVAEAGQAVEGISGNVINSGPTKSYPTDVRYVRVIYPAGSSVSTRSGTSTDGTCDFYGAPSSRCSELRTGTGGNDRSNYVFNHPSGDSGGAITAANGTYTIPSINNTLDDDLDVGDRVCYALLVRGHNAATGLNKTASYYSELQCSIIGKKPKVQVHGGNVSAGRVFTGSGDTYNDGARVETTLTNKQARSETVPAPEGSISGLWRTGVDGSNNKIESDRDDSHWQLDRVYRANGDTRQTCARAQTASGSIVSLPATSSGVVIPARTVVENIANSTGTAGMYSGANSIVGDSSGGIPGGPVWNRQSDDARWISHNLYGQNYSTSACPDPSTQGGTTAQQIALSNVYVYKLRNPIVVASDVNLGSIKLNVGGAMDNLVKFYVNGCELRSTRPTSTFGDGRWQEPGWSASAQAGAEAYVTAGGAGCSVGSTGFQTGANTFEIHVLSTYSHTGILIDQFSATATVTRAAANVFGSWTEYGIFAPGEIRWMASGSGLEGGNASSLQADWSRLTFTHAANAAPACSAIVYGCYTPGRTTLPAVASAFPVSAATPQIGATTTPSGLAGSTSDGRVVTTTQPVVTINAGDLSARRWAVLNAPEAHVVINGDLEYDDGPFTSLNQIPQLIIIARDITINSGVTRVDAWLIATNALSTCNERGNGATQISVNYASARLVADDCDRPLTVNGPVITDKLYLRRTAGSLPATSGNPTGPGEPAEVFNLRPDTYLWANTRMGSNRIYTTTGLQELPPRY